MYTLFANLSFFKGITFPKGWQKRTAEQAKGPKNTGKSRETRNFQMYSYEISYTHVEGAFEEQADKHRHIKRPTYLIVAAGVICDMTHVHVT